MAITLSNKVDNQNSLLSEEDPRIEISFLISDVTRRLRALYDVEMSQLGLSRAQWRALIGVLRLKAPLKQISQMRWTSDVHRWAR